MYGSERGVSEVMGVVLLLGMTVIVVGATVSLGSVALADSQSTAELQKAEGAMTQVDSKASLVAHGESTSQSVTVTDGDDGQVRVDEGAGWMNVTVEDEDGVTSENVTLGAVIYEHDDETVAYQGGGVWRSDGDHARMVSPPEFHYRDTAGTETLTLPLVTLTGAERLEDGRVTITDSGGTPERLFPTESGENPLVGGEVTITVGSEYAEAWGTYFEDRTRAEVTEIDDDIVEITLQTEIEHPALDATVSSTGQAALDFGGVETLVADSYDSTDGAYEDQDPRDGAAIQTRDEFRLTAGGGGGTDSIEINGDLIAESFDVPPGQEDKLNVTGDRIEEPVLDDLDPVSAAVDQRMDAVRDRNVAETNEIDGIELADDTQVIDEDTYVAGDVALDEGAELEVRDGATVHVDGNVSLDAASVLRFNVSDGDVDFLSEEELVLEDGSTVRAEGGTDEGEEEDEAGLFVDDEIVLDGGSSMTTDEHTRLQVHNTGDVELTNEASMTADDDVASNLWFYSTGEDIEIDGVDGDGIEFVGVFYAPESDVKLTEDMTIKGSFTFRSFEFEDANLTFHYDEALEDEQPFEGEEVPVVSYLHVSSHHVVIGDDD